MYTHFLLLDILKAVINRIVGHWKGGGITLKLSPLQNQIFSQVPSAGD